MNEFEGFLDRIGDASGQKGLVEAVRRGYRVLTEGTYSATDEIQPAVPVFSGWTILGQERPRGRRTAKRERVLYRHDATGARIILQARVDDTGVTYILDTCDNMSKRVQPNTEPGCYLLDDIIKELSKSHPYIIRTSSLTFSVASTNIGEFMSVLGDALSSTPVRDCVKSILSSPEQSNDIVHMRLETLLGDICDMPDNTILSDADSERAYGPEYELYMSAMCHVFGEYWWRNTVASLKHKLVDVYEYYIHAIGAGETAAYLFPLLSHSFNSEIDRVVDKILDAVELDPLSYTDSPLLGGYARKLVNGDV